jgi:hypothetical protein
MSQGAKLFVNSVPNSLNMELEFLENGLNTTFQEVYIDSPIRLDFIHRSSSACTTTLKIFLVVFYVLEGLDNIGEDADWISNVLDIKEKLSFLKVQRTIDIMVAL